MKGYGTILVACLLMWQPPAFAQVSGCDICHSKPDLKRVLKSGRVQSLYVGRMDLDASVHAGKQCVDCHVDVVEIPHTSTPQKVNCTQCHYKGNTVGAPQSDIYQEYKTSVHGRAIVEAKPNAPTCQDCHGSHRVLKHDDPAAGVAHLNVPTMCGRCHLDIYAEYRTSIHGVDMEKGDLDVPVCTDCHAEHDTRSHDDPGSPTHVSNVSKTCSKCHAAEGVVGKYGIDVGQVETYEASFHGVATQYGMRTVANCASCHGVHDIRSHEDPASMVYPANIPKTCGKCHPGANANFAKGNMHVDPKDPKSGIVYYVSAFFKWLTISTICGLVTHILLDLYRQFRQRGKTH